MASAAPPAGAEPGGGGAWARTAGVLARRSSTTSAVAIARFAMSRSSSATMTLRRAMTSAHSACPEHLGGRLGHDGTLEEPGVAGAPQAHGVGEREVAEVVGRDEAVLAQLPCLRQHVEHVGHVEVADVGAEQRVESRAERVDTAVERPRVHAVVGLTAEIERRHEQV